MSEQTCGTCHFLYEVADSSYHDCREDSPKTIVAAFKRGEGKLEGNEVGKIMTVWPRVSRHERGCGRYVRRS